MNQIESQFSVGTFHRMIHFGFWGFPFTHYNLEMIDQGLHIVIHLLLRRKVKLWNISMKHALRFFLNLLQGLTDNAQRLPHFCVAHHETVIYVALRSYRNLEVKLFIGAVWRYSTHVVVYARSTQYRP